MKHEKYLLREALNQIVNYYNDMLYPKSGSYTHANLKRAFENMGQKCPKKYSSAVVLVPIISSSEWGWGMVNKYEKERFYKFIQLESGLIVDPILAFDSGMKYRVYEPRQEMIWEVPNHLPPV